MNLSYYKIKPFYLSMCMGHFIPYLNIKAQ